MTTTTGIPKPGEQITTPETLRRYAEYLHDRPAPTPIFARIKYSDSKNKRGYVCFGTPGHDVYLENTLGKLERTEIMDCHFGEGFPRLELCKPNGRYAPMTEWEVPPPAPESNWDVLSRYGLEGRHTLDDPNGIYPPVYDEDDVVEALRVAEGR